MSGQDDAVDRHVAQGGTNGRDMWRWGPLSIGVRAVGTLCGTHGYYATRMFTIQLRLRPWRKKETP